MIEKQFLRRAMSHAKAIAVVVWLGSWMACGGGGSTSAPGGSGGSGGGGGGTGGGGVASFFFGMHFNGSNPSTPFPPTVNFPISGIRLWDSHTAWATTNTGPGVYDWTDLDNRVNLALSNKVDVLYDFARTPPWAQCANNNPACGSGDPAITCSYASINGEGGPGQCYPPSDLNVDGSGPNQFWIDWVTAVATRYKGQISYYEIWNEPNITQNWQGTSAQLVRMAGDARCVIIGDAGCNPQSTYSQKAIDPSAKLLTPAFTNPVSDMGVYLSTSLNGGSGNGGAFADITAFHGYPGQNPPERIVTVYSNLKDKVLAGQALQNKPVFDTEASWGAAQGVPLLTDPDQEAAFTARFVLIQQSIGIARFYWYAWDTPSGRLWTGTGLDSAGVSFEQVETWLTGSTLSTPCAANGNIWTCSYTRSSNYQALAVWDTSQTCGNGSCTTSSFTVPSSQFTQYQDVAGNTFPISAGTVPIGAKPILIETGNIP